MTLVNAPLERCFRLALSVDLQAAATRQIAVDGITNRLIGPGETVTWQARHFGWKFTHQSLIDVWRPYSYFRDVMVSGSFRAFEHEHYFDVMNDGTRLRNELRFAAPMGSLGRLYEKLLLRRKMIGLLQQRNAFLKRVAESDEWHQYLDDQPESDLRVYQAASAAPRSLSGVYAG
jgi:ligand-binding SRPBCC domain-containing protein